jgi:hypothetical protein
MPDWPADLPPLRISARPVPSEAVGLAWFVVWLTV